MNTKKFTMLGVTSALALTLAACGDEDTSNQTIQEQLDYEIIGIDAGTGVMASTDVAIETYDLDFNVLSSSDAAMTSELGSRYAEEEPIVVTAWTPHWKFIEYDLKFLDDPELAFGESEDIHTVVHPSVEEEHPSAFEVLDRFYWTEDDMGYVQGLLYEGTDDDEAAIDWITDNRDVVDEWIEGVEPVDGDEFLLASGAWDSERSSTAVVKNVLEEIGYEVNVNNLEVTIMWQAVAQGDAYAHVAAWLPHTHAAQYESFQDDVLDLGPNLEGARIGLAVPSYMDIDSIEDLRED